MAEYIGSTENENARRRLFDCAMQGKWDEAKEVYKLNPWLRLEKITVDGDTALHIAVRDRKENYVKEMVELVTTRQQYESVLKSQNNQGNTPLHLAASIGNVSMCECLAKRCKDLVGIRNEDGETPLFLAAHYGKIEAFYCLVHETSKPELASYIYTRNRKGETILHCAVAGGHFKLAFQILKEYEHLGSRFDEKGISPLHLLAEQPTAFRSGTRLSLIDKIIYHSIMVFRLWSGDTKKSDDPERQTLKKSLPVLWENIKICINPSGGTKAEKDMTDSDEENRPTSDQGSHVGANENGKKGGRNFPLNYDTCFNFIMLLIKAILGILLLGIGSSYVNKIRHRKEKHIWSGKILEKLLDKGNGSWYDSTGKNPLYKDRTITYKGEAQVSELPDLSHDVTQMHPGSEKSSKEGTNANEFGNIMQKQLQKVQRFADFMQEQLEEAQTTAECVYQLFEQAHKNELHQANEKGQEWHKILKEDSNWTLMQTMCEVINQTAKKLGDELPSKNVIKNQEKGKLGTPILIAAQNGINEMVESILDCFPMAIHDASPEKKNIVLLAVENRHPHVYKVLLKRVSNLTDSVFGAVDKNGNSALHLAAMFTDPRPWLTPGAALQMQWEVKWFEYVKNSMPTNFFPKLNNNGESPQHIFTDKHKELVQKGGEWLNNTATSCSVVSTLIATVAFATSSTLPGGNMESTGTPILEMKPAFHLFTISSLIALCFSISATIMFLAILTSRHREKDFAKDLPIKLLAGLTSLFVSILAILVSFCSAHFFMLQRELRSYALPIYAVTCLPATLFAIAQLPLYLDLLFTTFITVPQPPLEDN